ncbi:MAG: hypothetical protein Q8S39_16030, partial [Ignavibacteria bacterium]|nr:hypothetical protein [Ignavibacteria bacterium]
MNWLKTISILFLCVCFSSITFAQKADSLILKEGLVIKLDSQKSGSILSPDPVAALIETGEWNTLSENDELEYNDSKLGVWKK